MSAEKNHTCKYKIGPSDCFFKAEKEQLLSLLIAQGKVKDPTIHKLVRCAAICTCEQEGRLVAMGAIKPKTQSDFSVLKSGEISRNDDFRWELGYIFTDPDERGKGHSKRIVAYLIDRYGDENLMASTEIASDNPMKHILEKNGFVRYGKTWKSGIYGGELGLYLRYKTT